MSTTAQQRYKRVMERAAELADMQSLSSLLGWDQETKMPPKGVEGRSMVSATLAGLMHEKLTTPELGDDLDTLLSTPDGLGEIGLAQIQELHRLRGRAANVPGDLVRAIAEQESKATAVWADAKTNKDFAPFAPYLEEIVRLKRELAEAIGYLKTPYDALLEEYEPGAKTAEVAEILNEVRDFLVPLVQRLMDRGNQGDPSITKGPFDPAKQDQLGRELVEAMGFDMKAGRLDISNHPFTSGIHGGDVRLTTRYQDELTVGLFGTLHETGHGLYEQNLPRKYNRTPLGPATSLGIHESQSRLWENNVGRGRSFWKHFYPRAQELFPEQLSAVSLADFYRSINIVEPSFVRIESDEVTYNLHIVLRFELEQALIQGSIKARDMEEVWNEKFKEYLGITPPSPDLGVLQDIHWAAGLIGYFATYTLGNLYAAMLYAAARRNIDNLEAQIESGNLLPLRDWLTKNVHSWGRSRSASEIVQHACGKPLSTDDFKEYLIEKFEKGM